MWLGIDTPRRRPYAGAMARSRQRNHWGTPPACVKALWRREFRRRANRKLSLCIDWDSLQVPVKMWEETSLYDFY